jgi:penicillin amidase
LENVLRERPARWLPSEFNDYDELVLAGLKEAVDSVAERTGSKNINDWQWGRINLLRRQHPLASLSVIGRAFRAPTGPQAGTSGSLRAASPTFGPAMRFVADLADLDHSLLNLSVGESGQIFSPHYADHYLVWALGVPQRLPFSDQSLERDSRAKRLRLIPGTR